MVEAGSAAAIAVSHVTKTYSQGGSRVRVLDNVSFDVFPGETMAVVGRNGSGKTTLLRILARLSPPTRGRVVLRGRVAPMIALASGFFQTDLSGRENVRLVAKFFGVPDEVVERRLHDVAAFAGLERQIGDRVRSYSGGQMRRLAFSIMLNLEPQILLADEVLTVGDSAFREQCLQRVEEAVRDGLTLLLASHDLEAAGRLCTKAAWLSDGALVAHGRSDVVLAEYEREEGHGRPRRGAGRAAPSKRQNFNEHVALLSGAVFTMDGIGVDTATVDEELLLTMVVETATPDVEVRCVITLANERRWIRLVQPTGAAASAPGRYSASVYLPGGALHPGRYRGRIGVWLTVAGREFPVVRQNAFRLEIHDPQFDDASDEDESEEERDFLDDDAAPEVVEITDLAWKVMPEQRG